MAMFLNSFLSRKKKGKEGRTAWEAQKATEHAGKTGKE
jgi:hypothetical protein